VKGSVDGDTLTVASVNMVSKSDSGFWVLALTKPGQARGRELDGVLYQLRRSDRRRSRLLRPVGTVCGCINLRSLARAAKARRFGRAASGHLLRTR
jgi:hypothetical protein